MYDNVYLKSIKRPGAAESHQPPTFTIFNDEKFRDKKKKNYKKKILFIANVIECHKIDATRHGLV